MSDIQSTVNWFLSKEGGYLRSITILNKSGSATIPSGCYVQLRKCNIGTLTVGTGCTIVVEESTLSSVVMSSGSLTLDRVQVSGVLELDSVQTTQKLCNFQETVKLKNGCSLDGYKNNRQGMEKAFEASDNCRLTLREETITGGEIGLEIKNGCFASIRNCTIEVILRGVDGKSSCQVEVLGGSLQGLEGFGIILEGNCTAIISGLEKNIVANRAAISLSSSQLRMTNSKGINSVEFGVLADKNSSVSIFNFEILKTASNAVFKLTDGSSAECSSGKEIFSSGSDTIIVKDSSFTARKIEKIYSPASNAFFSEGGAKIIVSDISVEIRGYGNHAIEAQDDDSYSISRVPLLKGDGAESVKTGNNCTIDCYNVTEIIGLASHGIELGNDCKLSLKTVTLLEGVAGHGIKAGDYLLSTIIGVITIKGTAGDGINLGSNCNLRYSIGDLIHGFESNGVKTGTNCNLEFKNFGEIIGELEDGIDSPASLVTLLDGNKVIGKILNAVDVSGENGKVILRRVNELFGIESDGIRLFKGEADCRDFGSIKGGITGIRASASEVTAERGEMIKGWEAGVRSLDGSKIFISSLDLVYGAGKGALHARDNSSIETVSVKSVEASPFVIDSLNSKVECKSCLFNGGILAADSSSILLARVPVIGKVELDASEMETKQCTFSGGDFLITNSSLSTVNTSIDGNTIGKGSEFDSRKTEFKQNVTLTNCSIKGANVTFSGETGLTSSGGLFANSTAQGMTLVDSGVISSLCLFDPVAIVTSGYINIDTVKTHISHELLVDIIAAEVLVNTV